MNATHVHGFWEMPSSVVPGKMDFSYFASNGRLIVFVPAPPEPYPQPFWMTVIHWYRVDEDGGLFLRVLKPDAPEQSFTIQWEGDDTMIIHRMDSSPFEWRYQRVPGMATPEGLEKALEDANLKMDKRQAEFEAKRDARNS
jgi:hypothetical protein